MQLRWYHYIIYDLKLRLALYKIGRVFYRTFYRTFDRLLIILRLKEEPIIRLVGWTGKMYVSNTYLTGVLIDASRPNTDEGSAR